MPRCFFLNARGGTGKTFVLNLVLDAVRSLESKDGKNVAIAVASSGIASILLNLGRTFHSRFKAPLNIQDGMFLGFKANDPTGEVILCL